jgi:hypothetical protein
MTHLAFAIAAQPGYFGRGYPPAKTKTVNAGH